MGYMKHHAIIVTGWKREGIEAAFGEAMRLGLPVVGPGEKVINSYSSFLVAPDGSKEGWPESGDADKARESFKGWLRLTQSQHWLDWCEVAYSGDDREAAVIDHAWNGLGKDGERYESTARDAGQGGSDG